MEDLTGRVIKSYTLEELIDVGGFGAVYKAHQDIVNREVAIKVILPAFANQPDFIRRFETEAQLVARLEHLHIIPLYDYWRDPDGAYLVMRFLRGGNLHQALTGNRQWGIKSTVHLIEQIGSALAVAHQNNVIHQDLKPANILLDEQRNGYLGDFGIAADLFDPKQDRREDPLLGTPLFMAPEQFTQSAAVSAQTDIYSLGIVLYTMLTGRTPFIGADVSEVIYRQINDPVPPLQFTSPELPQELNIVIRRATAKAPEARYNSVMDMLTDLRHLALGESGEDMPLPSVPSPLLDEATGVLPSSRLPSRGQGTLVIPTQDLEPQNPYKGLRAFQEADAGDFYGRDLLIKQLLGQLANTGPDGRFLAVVGPSGSGKSSLVLAGLIPALRNGLVTGSSRWFVAKMVPGGDPFAELSAALLRIATDEPIGLERRLREDETCLADIASDVLPGSDTEMLLVIDQFEEVFTLVTSETERTHLLKLLYQGVTAEHSRLRIVVTLRADFYDRPLLYAGFGDLVQAHTQVVLPLSATELVQAIVRPADRTGLKVEEDLLATLVHDVGEQPGALPLLQYTLTELFDQRQDNRLTNRAYNQSGGILGALARRADEIYDQLEADAQQAAGRFFLQLVALSEEGEATRRRVRLAELLGPLDAEARAVTQATIDRFARHRLLTLDHDPQTREPTVEIAHEALIKAWKRLSQWLADSREDLLILRRLDISTNEWLAANGEASFLATGARLSQFELLANSPTLTPDQDQQDYLAASIALRQRNRNRARLFVAALAVIALVALILAVFAFYQRGQTEIQAGISRSRALAMTALTDTEALDTSLLLSLESLRTTDTFEARSSLLTLLDSPATAFLHGHAGEVRHVAVTPDGRRLISVDSLGMAILWDLDSRQPIGQPLDLQRGPINSVAISPDGTLFATGGEDQTVDLWDAGDGRALGVSLAGHTDTIWDLAFSPDGSLLASASADGTIILWDVAARQPLGAPLTGHAGTVYAVAFSPDGALLASGGANEFAGGDSADDLAANAVLLWDVAGGTLVGQHTQHQNWVRAINFDAGGQRVISGDANAILVLWDLQTGGLAELRTGHTGMINSLALSPDGDRLATASEDRTIRLWDMTTGRLVPPLLAEHRDRVWSVSFLPDGSLVSGSADRKIILWSLRTDNPLAQTLAMHDMPLGAVAFSPAPLAEDGALLAYGGGNPIEPPGDTSVRLWRLPVVDGTYRVDQAGEIAAFEGHIGRVTDIAFSPDGTLMATAGADQLVWLRPVSADSDGQGGSLLVGHTGVVQSVAFSPDGARLASAGDDGAVFLWDTATGEPVGDPLLVTTGDGEAVGLNAVAFHPDGGLLAAGDQAGHITLWDVATGTRLGLPLTGHSDEVTALAFAPAGGPDGNVLASGSRDETVILWDVATRQPRTQPLTGHANWVLDLAFSPDGTILASSDRDGPVILWDTATGRALGGPLIAHDTFTNALSFSPDGLALISGGDDRRVLLWDVNPASWQARACRLANRSFTAAEWARFFEDTPYHTTCPDAP